MYFRIIQYASPYKLIIILSIVSSFLFVFFNTFSFWMISSLISTIMNSKSQISDLTQNNLSINHRLESFANQLIGNGNQLEQLERLCIILVITFLLKNIFFMINHSSLSYVSNRIIMDIRNKLFSHLHKLPLSFFNKSKSGELTSIMMNDVQNLRVNFSLSIQSIINEPFSILVFIIILFIINMKMTFFVLLVIPIAGYIIYKLGQSVRRRAKRSSIQIAGLLNIFQETMNGIRIVKAFMMEKFEKNKFFSENKKFFHLTFKQEYMRSLVTPISDMIGILFGISLLWIGGREVIINNNLDSNGFIRYIIYLFAMLQPARKLGDLNSHIQSGLASAERVFNLMDVKSNILNPQNPKKLSTFKNELVFKNVSFQYENSKNQSLKNINIKILHGSTTALVGSSGAGKSTFVDLIPRFYDVTSGAILIDGVDIKKVNIYDLRKLFGIVTQETILFNDTILNNICYGIKSKNIKNVNKAIEAAHATDFIKDLPHGLNTIIGERGVLLSGGQKQRISIARAILKNPEILIFDEATSALDTASERQVQKAIDNLVKNRTVIVIAHRLSTITNADQIIVLDDGQLKEIGTHSKLLNQNGLYKKLYTIQYESVNSN